MSDCFVHRFNVKVCCGLNGDGSEYLDRGVLLLPATYSKTGKPTTLVISCHGAGGTVETDDSQVESQAFTRYLLANGLAVMDVNGLPEEFTALSGVDIRNNVGSPIAVRCYVNAYNYCMANFNLKREVFVHGASMGGVSSTNLVLSGEISVIAQSGFCPVLDTYEQVFLHPWSDGLPKTALGILYGFDKDERGSYVYNATRVGLYNPMSRMVRVDGKTMLDYPVPVKFWHCKDDGVVNINTTKSFVSAIKNNGGIAELRTFPQGGHEPQDYGLPIDSPSGFCVLNGEIITIKPAVEEAFIWLKSFIRD